MSHKSNRPLTLLEQVTSFSHLYASYLQCARGKRKTSGCQNFSLNWPTHLKNIENELASSGNFRWGHYREFFVPDPKKRLVSAAPFRDRVVHTAIHNVIEPHLDPLLGVRAWACRKGRGNRASVLRLIQQIHLMGKERYCLKLDVQKYFESIPHEKLIKALMAHLPDQTLYPMIKSLLASHPRYREKARGIPIGNLTSQLFANFYLRSFDVLATQSLGLPFDQETMDCDSFYARYMDDSVLCSRDKKLVVQTMEILLDHAQNDLELIIPPRKRCFLKADPVPFLGFLISENEVNPLARNERRYQKKLKRLQYFIHEGINGHSDIAQVIQSFESWRKGVESSGTGGAAIRGGNWNNGVDDGAFALNLNNASTNTNNNIGFRCSFTPL